MLGERYLLDTNALVALLQGHPGLLALVETRQTLERRLFVAGVVVDVGRRMP